MVDTPNLGLPYILAAQSQKHVPHNEAIRALDAMVQLSVLDRSLTAPPATPVEGDRYIVASSPTAAWSGQAEKIAAYQDGAWMFYAPKEGWISWVADENIAVAFDGAVWTALSAGGGSGGVTDHGLLTGLGDDDHPQYHNNARGDARYTLLNPTTFGINATADTTNRLSVGAAASLFNHAGTGGHQIKINKAAVADTASFLFQSAFSGRAEIGLTGDDDFHFKVSPNGTAFSEAIIINRTTGACSFPNTTFGGVTDGDKGDVTVSGTGAIWTVDADAVTNAKLANVPTATFKGRVTAAIGDPEDLTVAQAKTLLNLVGTNSGDQTTIVGITGTIAQFNTACTDADFATGGGTITGTSSGVNTGDQTITLTGDVSGTGTGAIASTLATVNATTGSFGLAASVAQFTVNAKGLITAAANVAISIASTAIADSTAAGRAMLTAATAAAQTALLSVFVPSGAGAAKGLVPAPSVTAGSTLFLREDGTWSPPPGAGGGEANTASNVGVGGVGVFKQKTGLNLDFKNINAGSSKVSVTNDAANSEIDLDVVEANLSHANIGGSLSLTTQAAGTLQAAQAPGFTGGDVISSAGSFLLSIVDGAVTNANLADMAANTVKGVTTAGVPTDLTGAQVQSLMTAQSTVQVFTASGTWTKPAGCRRVFVKAVAGGGGGAGATAAASNACCGAGGSSGSYGEGSYDVTATASVAVTVGAGGAAGAAANGAGGAGGASSFGALLTTAGGSGGPGMTSGTAVAIIAPQVPATTGAGGHINAGGNAGGAATRLSATVFMPGFGGAAPYCGSVRGSTTAGAGANGVSPGAGGAGAGSSSATGFLGGLGRAGIVIIQEFY